jgi:hypothetical protein
MPDPIVRVVLFPRPTAIWGTTPVSTEPFLAKDFSKAIVVAWRGTGMGSTPASATIVIEQSADMVRWFPIGGPMSPTANAEAVESFDLDLEWFRATATVSTLGTAPGATIWAVAGFVPRVPVAT